MSDATQTSLGWSTILVPHDFSENAAHAQVLAGRIAAACGGTVVLLHVTPLPPGMLPTTLIVPGETSASMTVADYTTGVATDRLEGWAAGLREKGVAVETAALLGGVAETIIEEAEARGVDVIVMGTHGRRGLAHLLLGSVAEKVIRQAKVPVITVREGETSPAGT